MPKSHSKQQKQNQQPIYTPEQLKSMGIDLIEYGPDQKIIQRCGWQIYQMYDINNPNTMVFLYFYL